MMKIDGISSTSTHHFYSATLGILYIYKLKEQLIVSLPGVILNGGPKASSLLNIPEARTFHHEYNSLACTLEIVDDVFAAIDHIHQHGRHANISWWKSTFQILLIVCIHICLKGSMHFIYWSIFHLLFTKWFSCKLAVHTLIVLLRKIMKLLKFSYVKLTGKGTYWPGQSSSFLLHSFKLLPFY